MQTDPLLDPPSPAPRRYSRRIVWLGVGVIVVCMLYTAGWFFLARKIETSTREALASLDGSGGAADCANPTARGFPLRIGLFCDSVSFSQPAEGVSVKAGAFRSAGQIYDPRRVVAELDGPASVTVPVIGQLALTWENLRASVRVAQPLPERVSVEGKAFKVASAAGAPVASAASFEGHMRPNGNDLDLAGSVASLSVDPSVAQGRVLPPLSGEADIGVTGGVALIADQARDLRGKSGTIRKLAVSLGSEGAVEVTGPFSVDGDGLVNAELKIAVRNPQALSATLVTAFPEAADQIRQGFAGLAMLGNSPTLPLRIARGNAVLGFIPLGKLPPL